MQYSLTFTGVLIVFLSQALELAGITMSTEELTQAFTTLSTLAAGVLILVERLKKGGVTWFGMKH